MKLKFVKKRDGRVVSFNSDRVTNAIWKAAKAMGGKDKTLAVDLSQKVIAELERKFPEKHVPTVEEIQDSVEKTLIEQGHARTAKAYILYRQQHAEIRTEKARILDQEEIDEVAKRFDLNALRVLKARYLRKDENGKTIETPKELFTRIAVHVGMPELLYDERVFDKSGKQTPTEFEAFDPIENEFKFGVGKYQLNRYHLEALKRMFDKFSRQGKIRPNWTQFASMLKNGELDNHETQIDEFYNVMVHKKFMPNTPAIANFGAVLGMGSACFVMDVKDNIEEIMDTLKNATIVFKAGGGVGYNFSKLRPEGDFVSTTTGAASGPISFMTLFDKMTEVIKQGGIRRGANMGILNCLSGDTEISTIEGRKPIKELVGTRPYVYCLNDQNEVRVRKAEKVIHSGKQALVRVTFDDDTHIDCTPDHRVMLSNGQYRPAQDLKIFDSVMAFHKKSLNERYYIGATASNLVSEHIIAAECNSGVLVYQEEEKRKPTDLCIHHKDENPLNNHPDNLQVLTISEHAKLHLGTLLENQERISQERKGKTIEVVYGKEKADAWKQKMSDSHKSKKPWNKNLTGDEYTTHYEKGFGNQFAQPNHKVISVQPLEGTHDIYDIIMEEYHNFVANGVFVHNSNHPDIEKFITAKEGNKQLTNFNISVLMMPDFWNYYHKNEPYPLVNPRNSEVIRTVNPRLLFDMLVYQAWESAEPGVIFYDHVNKYNPFFEHLGPIVTTNPCVTGDTLVSTANGLERIDSMTTTEITIDQRTMSNLNSAQTTTLQNGTLKAKATQVIPTGTKEVFLLKTNSGFEVKATADHRILTPTGWKPVEQLKTDDSILIQSGQGAFNPNSTLPFNPQNQTIGKNGRTYRFNFPTQWTYELGLTMGWLVGDGWLNTHYNQVGLVFSKPDFEAQQTLQPIFEQYCNRPIRITNSDQSAVQIRSNSQAVTDFFSKLGVTPVGQEKEVPKTIFTANEDAVRGFLKGLFSSDGTIACQNESRNYARLNSSSRKLLQGTQLLLLNLGIKSAIYDRSTKPKQFTYTTAEHQDKTYFTSGKNYELNISKENLPRFLNKIGFIQSRHNQTATKIQKHEFYREYFTEKIASITTQGLQPVWDLTEPISHSFIGNGILLHNCGEVLLYPNESCNLGSINVWAFFKEHENGEAFFDWQDLQTTVKTCTKLLDNVIDVNKFPLKPIEDMTDSTRKIGLGIMGLADLLYELRLPYRTEEGRAMMEQLMEFVNYYSKVESIELAKERGPIPYYNKSFYPEGRLPIAGPESKDKTHFDWDDLKTQIQKHGVRNGYTTIIAPTGSISMIAGCSSGIEPVYSLVFEKNVKVGSFYYIDPVFERIMKQEGLYDNKLMEDVIDNKGTVQNIPYLTPEQKRVFVTAMDITPEEHIRALAAFQKWVDSSISKTNNFPADATVEDMRESYILAYELGCKDVTVFRDSSIKNQVLNAPKKKETAAPAAAPVVKAASPTPPPMTSATIPIQTASIHNPNNRSTTVQQAKSKFEITNCPNCEAKTQIKEGCVSCPECGWGICN